MRGGPAVWIRVGAGVLALHAWAASPAVAQTAGAAAGDGAPSEAARRQALSPFRMILQNADAPRRPTAPAPAPKRPQAPAPEPATAAAPARAAPTPPPTPEPVQAAPAAAEAPKAEQVTAVQPSAAASKAPAEPPPIELVPLQQDPPMLNATLRREQPQGKVLVAFSVSPDGSTTDVRVVSSSDRRLNSASVHAVSGWRFQPIREAQPVEVELVYGDQ